MSRFRSEHGISEAANAPGARCLSPLEVIQPLISSIKKEKKKGNSVYTQQNIMK